MQQKFRWSKFYESAEEELIIFLRGRNVQAERISAEAMTETLQQVSETGFTVWCAEGSVVIRQGSRSISLQPGDALGLDADTPYDIIAGMTGYVCYVSG